MTFYQACLELDIWREAKAHAELLDIFDKSNSYINRIKVKAKTTFKELALQKHPDKGGSTDEYIKLREALDIIDGASDSDLMDSLKVEKKETDTLYKPGSEECFKCTKWNDIVDICMTASCSGFKGLNGSTTASL